MRIGTIAQHANIGPKKVTDIVHNTIPGRINDFPVWAWWDFTDDIAVGGGSAPLDLEDFSVGTTTENGGKIATNILQCDGKGPYDADLSTDDQGKGPDWFPANHPSSGQDGYPFLRSVDASVEYMQFTNPANLAYRDFTIIMVMDKVGDTNSSIDEYLFTIGSTGESMQVYTQKNSNTLITFFEGSSHARVYDNFWTGQSSGDFNYNFNWIAFTSNKSTNKIDLYSRGVLQTPDVDSGTVSTDNIASGAVSVILGNDSNTNNVLTAKSPGLRLYEFLVYEKALTAQDLYSFDRYIGDKYSTYPYGRFGNI